MGNVAEDRMVFDIRIDPAATVASGLGLLHGRTVRRYSVNRLIVAPYIGIRGTNFETLSTLTPIRFAIANTP